MKPTQIGPILLAPIFLSFAPEFNSAGLLSPADLADPLRDLVEHRSALSSPQDGKTPFWESFNQWLCFPSDEAQVECEIAEYPGPVPVPAIQVIQADHFFELSLDPDPRPNCDEISRRWRFLISSSPEFCVLAAPLQTYEGPPPDPRAKDGSVWIVNRVKSAGGEWRFEEPENWLDDSREDDSQDD